MNGGAFKKKDQFKLIREMKTGEIQYNVTLRVKMTQNNSIILSLICCLTNKKDKKNFNLGLKIKSSITLFT